MLQDLGIFLTRFRNQVERIWSEGTALKESGQIYGPFIPKGQCVVTSLLLQQVLREEFPELKTHLKIGRVLDSKYQVLIPNHGWLVAKISGEEYIIDTTIDQIECVAMPYLLNKTSFSYDLRYESRKTMGLKAARNRQALWSRYLKLENSYRKIGNEEHYCDLISYFPRSKFLQKGSGIGKSVLVVGEAPAPNGWRISGRAFYTPTGKLLPTGKNLNKLLNMHNLDVENIGFTEMVKCFPGENRSRLRKCGGKTWPIFVDQLHQDDYRLVILLGIKALEVFNEQSNCNLPIGELNNACIDGVEFAILPIYHPSPIAPYNHAKNIEILKYTKNEVDTILT